MLLSHARYALLDTKTPTSTPNVTFPQLLTTTFQIVLERVPVDKKGGHFLLLLLTWKWLRQPGRNVMLCKTDFWCDEKRELAMNTQQEPIVRLWKSELLLIQPTTNAKGYSIAATTNLQIFFSNIPAHQSQCWYICKTFRSDIPPASSVTNWWKNSNYRYRERGLYGFYRHKPRKQFVPILHKLHVDRDKVESLQVVSAKFR